jgi:hypothetical protein
MERRHTGGVDVKLELLGEVPTLSFCSGYNRRLTRFGAE